uniref:Uncharacterized protein n=1 Tax=Romanomermis culicivorax TaxID=13658 RepID=A0A915ICJ6_ROMCU
MATEKRMINKLAMTMFFLDILVFYELWLEYAHIIAGLQFIATLKNIVKNV